MQRTEVDSPMAFAGFRGLPEEVRDHIRERILAGAFDDGARIVERELAADLGVSRGPVRDALRLLEAEGLVISSPRRGTRVAMPNADDAAEMFAIRAALEPLAAAMLLRRGAPEALRELEAAVAELEAAAAANDWARAIAGDLRFHGVIFRWSGSRRLTRIWEGMHNSLLQIFRLHRPLYRSIDEVPVRHRAYLDAIQNGDVAEVERHAAEHVTEFRDRLMRQFDARVQSNESAGG
ncbi:MAG TPA: GntR family transcriptional regulator [Candidatus Acidoferrum sp.]|nr:GntR family transcriptional regulator [Candidatus Acidoferrum sp.]